MFQIVWFFFFQAEDGIRDLVRSRGLGDVYKRQQDDVALADRDLALDLENRHAILLPLGDLHDSTPPVSYTHLTLPTSDLV